MTPPNDDRNYAFDRLALLATLDDIGTAAAAAAAAATHGTRLDLAIYDGSALMLASNFRFATEDVDIAELGEWPAWLSETAAAIAPPATAGRRTGSTRP